MDRQQRGEQLFQRLVRRGSTVPARVFPKSSTWSWLRDPAKVSRAAGLTRTGLGMLGIDPISYGLGRLGGLGFRALGKLPYLSLNTLLPEEVAATTLGSRAALASGVAGGLLAGAGAFMGIWGGMAGVGQAKLEGQRIAQARLAIGAYANKYAETLAGYANALDGPSAYQPEVAADLPAWLKPWQQRAIADAHAALKALGEQDGRAVLRHLKDSYREPRAIARALRQGVLHHALKHVSPQLRRFLNLTGELGGGTRARAGHPQPKVEQGVQIDADTVYWPKRDLTQITKPFVIDLRDEVVERAIKPLPSPRRRSRIIRTPMMHIEGQVPSADGSRITGPPSTAGQGIRIDEHTIYYPERKFTRFTKPFVIDLRGSGQGSIPSPGSSRMIGAPPMQGPRYSFLDPVKIADWKLQMTPDRPRPITIPTGSDSALNTLRQMERRAAEREKTQGWLQGLEQQYLRPGTSSVGARVPSLSDKGLGTGVGSLHKGSTLNRSGGFSARLSSGFSPALEGLQNQLSRLSKGLEMPMLSGSRASTVGDLSGIGRLGDFSLRDTGIKLGLERLRQDAWHGPWRSSPSGLSLRDSGGGSLRNLWNAGAGFSSGSTLSANPPSIRLSTSPSLMSSGPGGSPGLNFNPLAPPGLGGVPGFGY